MDQIGIVKLNFWLNYGSGAQEADSEVMS
jgi:hypothetical protein